MNRYFVIFAVVIALLACTPKVDKFSGNNEKLGTEVGIREGDIIKSKSQSGFLVYGPYIPLKQGVYRLVAKGSLAGSSTALGVIDVVAEKGQVILAVKPIITEPDKREGEIVSLVFEIVKPVADIEFRINISPQTTGFFVAYELTNLL